MAVLNQDPDWPTLDSEGAPLEEYTVPFAQHVKGRIERRKFKDKLPEPQKVYCKCEQCGRTWQTTCSGGTPRAWVQSFATKGGHLHRDPFEVDYNARTKKLGNEKG